MYDTHLQFEKLETCAVLALVEIIGIPLFTVHLFRDATPTTPGALGVALGCRQSQQWQQ